MSILHFEKEKDTNKGLPPIKEEAITPGEGSGGSGTPQVGTNLNTLNGVYLTVDGEPVLTSKNKKELRIVSDTLSVTHSAGEIRIEGGVSAGEDGELNVEGMFLQGSSW